MKEIGNPEQQLIHAIREVLPVCAPYAACAIYLLHAEEDLTLTYGNRSFFDMIKCSEQEMRHRYGNRGALFFDLADLQAACAEPKGGPLEVPIQRRDGSNVWALTECLRLDSGMEFPVFLCISFEITKYKQAMEEFQLWRMLMRKVMDHVGLDIFLLSDSSMQLEVVSSHMLLGALDNRQPLPPGGLAELLMQRNLLMEESADSLREALSATMERGQRTMCELRMRSASGRPVWMMLSLSRCVSLSAEEERTVADKSYVIGTFENVTGKRETAANQIMEAQFYHNLLAANDAFGHVNVTADRILHVGGLWGLYNELIDRISYTELFTEFINKVVHPEDRAHYIELIQCRNMLESYSNGIDKLGSEFRRIVEQNKMVWMQISIHLIQDSDSKDILALMYLTNIHEKKKRELRARYENEIDQLTQVFNRKTVEDAAKQHLRQLDGAQKAAFLILDVDDLKEVNDTYGHIAGDQLLTTAARLLSQSCGKEDMLGRYGGDEFILLMKRVSSREEVEQRLDALYDMIEHCAETPFHISAGVSFVESSQPYEQVFEQADSALYLAKRGGKARYRFYSEQDTPQLAVGAEQGGRGRLPAEAARVWGGRAKDATEEFDRFISEQGDIAYLVEADTYTLLCANRAFYDRIGRSEAECVGLKCYEAMQGRTSPCPFCSRANWSTDRFYIWRNLNRFLEQEFLIKNKLVHWKDKEVMLAIAVDIANNKNIADSIENTVSESDCVLSGVERMLEGKHLHDVMEGALETVGSFFGAAAAQFWRRSDKKDGAFECDFLWHRPGFHSALPGEEEKKIIYRWILSRVWKQPVVVESPEIMLRYSYDMHLLMKRHQVQNQKWFPVHAGDLELGFVCVENITANFANNSFLESFSVFIAHELKRRLEWETSPALRNIDRLTGLLDRSGYEAYVMSYRVDELRSLGVINIDLNNLGTINSDHGFQTGDHYLRQLALLLRKEVQGNTAYRLNGDEFLIILENIDHQRLNELAEAVRASVAKDCPFTVSIGVAWDDVEKNILELVDRAGQIKRVNKAQMYRSGVIVKKFNRHKHLKEIIERLESGAFLVYLQPKYNFVLKKIVGAEALIRYKGEDGRIVPPSRFIDLMEKNNLIRYIDLFVMERVCGLLEAWNGRGIEFPSVSVNFSRRTLQEDDILHSIGQIIGKHNLSPKQIEIEVTESMTDMGKGKVYRVLRGLSKAGFGISLDDFGIKYTNLSILSDINIDVLKLDRSLTNDLTDNLKSRVIVKNVISMCGELDIDVIAEGIETQGQANILRQLGCKIGQGYLYGKPVPVSEFEKLLC